MTCLRGVFAADNSICVETTKRLYYLQPSPLVAIDSWIQSLVHASHAFRRNVASTSAQLVTLAGTRARRVSAALESPTLWPSAPPRDRAVCGGVGSLLLLLLLPVWVVAVMLMSTCAGGQPRMRPRLSNAQLPLPAFATRMRRQRSC